MNSGTRKRAGGKARGRVKGSGKANAQEFFKTVEELGEKERELIREMLTSGATVEDAVEAVKDLSGKEVMPRVIEHYFRRDVELQKARVRQLLTTARELKQVLADPEGSKPGQSEFAEAILLTGLMGVSRRETPSQVRHAERLKDVEENLRLKADALRLKSERFDIDRKFLETRVKAETARLEILTDKVRQLKEAVDREGSDKNLSPEILNRIREIYGLAALPEGGPAA